jgi:PucR family transcriptional regulator, purine catabolism regulatory protein
LLTRLLAEADEPPGQVLEHATAAGWVLGGTHTGVHVRARAGADRALVRDRLGERLSVEGVTMHPVPDGDGWSLWTTSTRTPAPGQDVVAAVRHALLAVERDCPGAGLYAGVGTADDGTAGLRRSLQEARRACVLAAARNAPGAVEHIGANSVKRLLSNHYLTTVHRDLAHQLLAPLMVADASGQLVHTLSCYLDNESSATAAAAALGVHRNTVLQRLDRIRALLTVEFNDADERLALQLATRLVQSGPRRALDDVTGTATPAGPATGAPTGTGRRARA